MYGRPSVNQFVLAEILLASFPKILKTLASLQKAGTNSLFLHGTIFNQLNITRSPASVKPGLKRPIETKRGVPAFPRQRLEPVRLMPQRGSWSEPDINGRVRIDYDALRITANTRKLLVSLEI